MDTHVNFGPGPVPCPNHCPMSCQMQARKEIVVNQAVLDHLVPAVIVLGWVWFWVSLKCSCLQRSSLEEKKEEITHIWMLTGRFIVL